VYKAAYPASKINLEEARAEAREKALQRREKLADVIRRRLQMLLERLQKKQILLEKHRLSAKHKSSKTSETNPQPTQNGIAAEVILQPDEKTKTVIRLESDIARISEEISRTETALETALKNAKAARNGLSLEKTVLPECKVQLSEAQQKAYTQILEGFECMKPVMLHGVTGSGKTEIYIKAAHEALAEGRNVLYLVPEIALSRQLEERLYEHFEDRLLTFHSGETAAAKRNIAEIIRSQRGSNGNYILLGTRSALFLPHHNLGLIVVDEEHDNSYKQDSPAPRYNARDTALMLYQLQNASSENSTHNTCNILLGSATPSLEEMYNCLSGRHFKVELNQRFHGSENARIEIIDTKAERRKNGMIGNFSRVLIGHINNALSVGGQVLILRSRRAWATTLQCSTCGEIQKCPHCNVSLSLHKAAGQQKCHYCGKTIAFTGKCCKCGGELTPLGAGTQRIEEEAIKLFPNARVARLDSDTAQNKGYETQTIKAFAKGEIDILIGTQMVTKGFDFENLRLVAAIAADSMLGIQDFRADEKALQILEQFRGRCGRRSEEGLFVIQTAQPEHPIYQNLKSNETRTFNMQLLEERKDFNFPPFSRIIEITLRDKNEKRAYVMSCKLADKLSDIFSFDMLTGPYQPVVDKIEDEHIRKIRVSLKKNRDLIINKTRLIQTVSEFESSCRYAGHITLNVDPI
jgi:primosomal protein N' (replication factor Y)